MSETVPSQAPASVPSASVQGPAASALLGPLPPTVRLSLYQNTWDAHPPAIETTWPELITQLVGPRPDGASSYSFAHAKNSVPMFSPAEFGTDPQAKPCTMACCRDLPEDQARAKLRKTLQAVRAVHFAVLDFDDVTTDELSAACVKADPFVACVYTTWSHPEAAAKGLFRARLVVALTRPCAPQEWGAVYSRLAAYFGSLDGTAECRNPNRAYYVPSLPVGAEWAVQTWRSQGTGALDVDALLRMPAPDRAGTAGTGPGAGAGVPGGSAFVASDPITGDMVRRFAERLSKRADPNEARMGNLLRAGLEGEAFAAPGQHDATLWALACVLGEQFTTADPEALASLFRPALSLMAAQSNHPDKPAATAENLAEKISRAQRSAWESRAAKAEEGTVQRNRKIEIAFLGKRSHPYTPDELARFAAEQVALGGADPAAGQVGAGAGGQAPDLFGRWLVQKGNGAYIFFDGGYRGPFKVRGELAAAAGQFLAPAVTAGVELHETDSKGNVVPKSGESLISQYGRVVEIVEADMTASKAYLALDRHAIVEAPCPVRPLEPAFDADVAEWLALLAGRAPGAQSGGKVDALLDWLAAVTMLAEPAPALYLKGEPGSGKSVLAMGLARLWGADAPTSMRAVMAQFNGRILECPLVLADEKVPESWSGQPRTEELRELITATAFSVERKGQEAFRVRGSIRAILAANNLKLISSKEEFTREDALALADRFLFVCPHPAARDWFIQRGGNAFGKILLGENRIAKHALWLRQEHEQGRRRIKPGGRLVVPGDAGELVQLIQTSGGAAWPALYWLWSFLHDPLTHVRACAGQPFAAVVKDGELWVSFKRLWESWDHYLGSDRTPSLERLTAAAKGVVLPKREARYQPRGARAAGVTYQRIDLDAFREWVRGIDEDAHTVNKGPGGLLEHDTEGLALEAPRTFSPN
jgi:hypothetical protein